MGFIPMICPQCGAQIEIVDSRDFGFCSYCGTKIVRDKIVIEHRGSISLDHSAEIKNLLLRAGECMRMGDIDGAEKKYEQVLTMDYDNAIARRGLQELYRVIKEPNFSLAVTISKFYNKTARVDVTIDGVHRGEIANGYNAKYKLEVGSHSVRLKIVSVPFYKLDFTVDIKDRFTKVNYLATCKIGNKIELSDC